MAMLVLRFSIIVRHYYLMTRCWGGWDKLVTNGDMREQSDNIPFLRWRLFWMSPKEKGWSCSHLSREYTLHKWWRFPLQISSVNGPDPQETADLITFTEEILNGKLHFLCSDIWRLWLKETRTKQQWSREILPTHYVLLVGALFLKKLNKCARFTHKQKMSTWTFNNLLCSETRLSHRNKDAGIPSIKIPLNIARRNHYLHTVVHYR